jgi:hypothetical protein
MPVEGTGTVGRKTLLGIGDVHGAWIFGETIIRDRPVCGAKKNRFILESLSSSVILGVTLGC